MSLVGDLDPLGRERRGCRPLPSPSFRCYVLLHKGGQMRRRPDWFRFLVPLLFVAAPAIVDAVQFDVRGNWQVNINCDLNATASIFFLLD